MSNYRRTSKPKTEHIKKGFTVFQKTIATIGSILGLITATITIMNAMDKNKKEEPTTPQQTTVIREIQKEAPTDTNSPTQKQTPNQDAPQKEETQPSSSKEEKTKEDGTSKIEQKDTSSSNSPTSETGTTASNSGS
ncbi:DUF6556 family protein [Streptococcus oralis]|uniref:Histone acetyltransferase Gcn5 n=1 Tax=Streptococcus oralis TaxID=1303 RepID=A0A4Q2FPU8_STROR|nr:DUF6556 family protein [Streptococcus oralis]MCY7075048.1 hypothetical protein [Streptococcus oralis]RXX23532.1 hypothetical protein DF216_01955 [Streptococcus oralis]